MRVSGVKRVLACVMCVLLVLAGLPVAGAAGETTLSVDLRGLTATAEGRWVSAPLTGTFEVYAGETSQGRVTANPTDGSADVLTLTSVEGITLQPVAGTFTAGYLVPESRVAVSVKSGKRNDPPVLLYADAGLFTVAAQTDAAFTVTDESGAEQVSFTVDETGVYALPQAIPAGTYTLTQTAAPAGQLCAAPQVFSLAAYTGKEEQILPLTVDAPALPTGAEQLGELTIAQAQEAASLTEGAQELTGVLTGICQGQNPWSLDSAVLTLAAAVLTEDSGAQVTDGQAAFASITWTGEGAAPTARFLNAADEETESAVLVSGEAAAVPQGTDAVKLDWGAVAAAFDGGEVAVTVRAEARTAEQAEVRGMTLGASFDWSSTGVAGGQESEMTWTFSEKAAAPEATAIPEETTTPEETAAPMVDEAQTMAPETAAVQDVPAAAGTMRITVQGADTSVVCTLLSGGTQAAEGMVTGGELLLEGLTPGEYTVLAALPDGLAMIRLNGYDNVARGQVTWTAEVQDGVESRYDLTLDRTGSVSCTAAGIPDGTEVSLVGTSDRADTTVSGGSFTVDALCPGDYTVTLPLTDGLSVAGENWQTVEVGDGLAAVTTITVQGGIVSAIPELSAVSEASIGGEVYYDENGNGLREAGEAGAGGLIVTLVNERGETVGSVSTDGNGAWQMDGLHSGVYALSLTLVDGMALLGRVGECVFGDNGQTEFFTLGGEAMEHMNAAVVEPGRLETNVFIDANSNGEKGTYERTLAGVSIAVVHVTDSGETIAAAASSTQDGEADFDRLAPGTYKLRVTLPAGYAFGKKGGEMRSTSSIMEQSIELTQDSMLFTIEAGQTTRAGIGINTMATVTGRAWLDQDANGIMAASEPGQSGVTVTLTGVKNGRVYEVQTDADGYYSVGQIWPGTYKMTFTCPEGLMFTKYSATGRENRSIITTEGKRVGSKEVTLEAGDTLSLQYVGLVQESVITGVAFLDANYNGLYDAGELPLAGVTCELLKSVSGKTVATVTTGEDGAFTFVALRENTYRLRAVLPNTGVTFTATVDTSVRGNWFKSREGRREYSVDDLALGTGETKQIVIGAIMPGTITGTVYLDNDFSATQSSGEKSVSGMQVSLLDASGTVVATDNTNNKGLYEFDGITPGTYQLMMTAKTGYAFTKLGEGNVLVNQGGGVGRSEVFSVALGQGRTGMDIGMILPGTVQGTVFADLNDNGVQDEGETGLAGTCVKLMTEEGESFIGSVDANGAYVFDAVMPGRYFVRYELPQDTIFAQAVSGGNTVSGEGSVGASGWFDFKTADQVTMPLCGGVTLGAVTGTAYEDVNGSGAQDAGEGSLAGVTVTLTPSRTDLETQTVTTDASGSFALTGLHPDTYTLSVDVPEGMVLSRTDGTTLPVKAGLASQQAALTLPMGQRYDGQVLGAVRPASAGGVLWMDENNDGVMDAGERTPAGREITVIDERDGSVFAVLTTGEDGSFGANGLIPGSYTFSYALNASTISAPAGESTFITSGESLVHSGVAVTSGDSVSGLKCGIVCYSALGGMVWVDENGAYSGLAGASVSLLDENGAALLTTTSGEDGSYFFTNLLPGTYTVTAMLPAGRLVVDPTDDRLTGGGHVSVLTQVSGREGKSDPIVVRMDEERFDLAIGAVLPGKLGDQAWLDLDGDGWQEAGEPGLSGVTVRLIRSGVTVAETTTNAYGYYLLENIYPSSYTLEVTYPAEVKPTKKIAGNALVSVLEETEDTTATAQDVRVESDRSNFSVHLGFQLRQAGVLPAGIGEAPTQDWTK